MCLGLSMIFFNRWSQAIRWNDLLDIYGKTPVSLGPKSGLLWENSDFLFSYDVPL